MSKLTARLCALTVDLLAVAATPVAKSATWRAIALLQTSKDHPSLVVVDNHNHKDKDMVVSVLVTVSPTIGLLHATSVAGQTTMLEIVRLRR